MATASVATRGPHSRRVLSTAAAGFLAAALAVVAGGQAGIVDTTTPLTTWVGLLSSTGYRPGQSWLAGLLLFVGIAALVLLWLVVLGLRGQWRERDLWWIAAAWSAPFVVGPPLISKDVFSYAAQGLMLRSGLDPYSSGVSALAAVPTDAASSVLAAVDPTWRSAPSPYGPVALTIEHLAVAISGGNPLGAVIALRGLAVLCVIAIGVLAMQLAGDRRTQALILTVLNPLVLVHLVSGAHFEAPMGALLLGSLVAAKRNHWVWALVLACAAGSIKAPAFLAVPAIVATHVIGQQGRRARLLMALRDVGVSVVSLAGFTLLVSNGLGWIKGLNTPALGYTPFAPASLIADLFKPVVPGASFDNLVTGGRVACLLAAACIVIYLIATTSARPLEHTVGYGLLAAALLSPTIFPWYLLWGALCLVGTADVRQRDWLVAGCGVASVAAITGAPTAVTNTFDAIAAVTAAALLWRRARRRKPQLAQARSLGAEPSTAPAIDGDPQHTVSALATGFRRLVGGAGRPEVRRRPAQPGRRRGPDRR